MSDPAESTASEWRIVQLVPNEGHPLGAAIVRALNDNNPASRRLRQRLEAYVNRLLRVRGVRAPAAGSMPETAPSADGPKV
jgi:hypothetical protein